MCQEHYLTKTSQPTYEEGTSSVTFYKWEKWGSETPSRLLNAASTAVLTPFNSPLWFQVLLNLIFSQADKGLFYF